MLATEAAILKQILSEMNALGQSTLALSQQILDALTNGEPDKLRNIKRIPKQSRYKKIDHIDNLIIKVFALYKPEAKDLRRLVAFLKITNEFDRIANSYNSFVRDFPRALSDDIDTDLILEYAISLQKSTISALENALILLTISDITSVAKHYKIVVIEERKNDELYKNIEKNLLKKSSDNIHLAKDYQDVMVALRRLEKVADRALNIASLMHYAKVGGDINQVTTQQSALLKKNRDEQTKNET